MITRVDRRRTFSMFRRDGRRARSGSVRLSFLPLDTSSPQLAFAIGRSFGNAVERNRGRRRLRAAFVEALSNRPGDTAPGAYLLTGDRGLLTDDYATLVRHVNTCLDKLFAQKDPKKDPKKDPGKDPEKDPERDMASAS